MRHHHLPKTLDAVARVLRWHRRSIAAVAAFLAVFAGLSALRPASEPTVAVAAAARDLPGGAVLTSTDLTVVQLPSGAVPAGSVPDVGALVGRTLNAPLSARSPVTETSVATGSALARPGYSVMVVPLPDPALASLLKAGSRVDLIASGKSGVIASDVRVLASPSSSGGGMLSSASQTVLVEVTPTAAAKVAEALNLGEITLAIR